MSDALPGYGALGSQLQGHAASLGLPAQPHLGQPGVFPAKVTLPEQGAAPVPLESALPGSQIAVFAPGFDYGERCTVMRVEPEWGPTSVPALHLVDSKGERKLLPSTMQGARIEILVSAETLGIEQIPEGAIRARNRPIDVAALQFKGGAGEAAKFILWAAKHASIRYSDESDDGDEFMVIQRLDKQAEEYLRPGDYLVKNPDGEFHVISAAEFPELYEEVSLVG